MSAGEKLVGAGAVIMALCCGLAGAVWRWPRHRTVLLAVAAAMLAFAALDIREVVHQIDESRAGLAILAAAVAAAHLAAAALSGWLQRAGSA